MEKPKIIREEIEKHVLSILACEKGFDLGGFCIQNLKVSAMHGLFDNELLFSLHTLIPAESMKEETHTFGAKWPADWKEAFKERYFPKWLKKRYPIKYEEVKETVKFTAYNLYPKYPAVAPERCIDSVQRITKYVERWKEELNL